MEMEGSNFFKQRLDAELSVPSALNAAGLAGLVAGVICAIAVGQATSYATRRTLATTFAAVAVGQFVVGVRSKRVLIPGLGALVFLADSRLLLSFGLRVPHALLMVCLALVFMLVVGSLGGLIGELVAAKGKGARTGPKVGPAPASAPAVAIIASPRRGLQEHIERALLFKANGQLEAAAAELREVIRLHPRSAAAHGNLGVLLSESGQPDEAIIEFQAAVQADAMDAGAYFRLGMLLGERGRWAEAVAAYEDFLALCGQDAKDHADFARRGIAELKRKLADGP